MCNTIPHRSWWSHLQTGGGIDLMTFVDLSDSEYSLQTRTSVVETTCHDGHPVQSPSKQGYGMGVFLTQVINISKCATS